MSKGTERLDPYGDRSEPAWVGRNGEEARLPLMMDLGMAPERRDRLIQSLEGFYLEEFDETLSEFRAARLLDFIVESIAPHVYEQAVQDARAFMQRKLDELDGEVAAPWG